MKVFIGAFDMTDDTDDNTTRQMTLTKTQMSLVYAESRPKQASTRCLHAYSPSQSSSLSANPEKYNEKEKKTEHINCVIMALMDNKFTGRSRT